MDETIEKENYRKVLNLLNQINQDLIFYNRDFPLLKETLNQSIKINQQFIGKNLCEEIQKNIEVCIQQLNKDIIPSIVQKLN